MTNTLGNQSNRRKTKYDTRSADELKTRVMSVKPKRKKTVESKVDSAGDGIFDFYLMSSEYKLGTPKRFIGLSAIAHINFFNFAENYELLNKLEMPHDHPNPFTSGQVYENQKTQLKEKLMERLISNSMTEKERSWKEYYLYSNGVITIHTPKDESYDKINEIQEIISNKHKEK
jgi:hypothetical protein